MYVSAVRLVTFKHVRFRVPNLHADLSDDLATSEARHATISLSDKNILT
jgi:hypothetical protein